MKRYLKYLFKRTEFDNLNNIFSMLEKIGLTQAVLLDCGCSDGELTMRITTEIGAKEVHGIDLFEEKIKEAEKRGIIVHQDDLNKTISMDDESVDVVVANQLIEHLYDTDNFVREIHRVLKLGGYGVISTENLSSWHNIFALILGWQPFSMSNISCARLGIGNPLALLREENKFIRSKLLQHSRVLSYLGLQEIFEVHRFKVEKVLGAGYYPLPHNLSKIMCKLDIRHSAFLAIKIRKSSPDQG